MNAVGERAEAARLMRLATYASVSTALVLVLIKAAAWVSTGSVSLLSSLVDSLLDAAASLVMLLAVRQSLMPADAEHRFGHGKAEPLAALAQAAFIAGSAFFLLIEAGQRLWSPQPVAHPEVGLAVMGFSIVATLLLTRFQAYVARKTGSLAIRADRLHYFGDLLVNLAVVAALLLSDRLGWHLADPIMALLIVGYIVTTSWRIGREALDMLMDRELPDADRQRIVALVKEEPEVRGLHDLRTRAAGQQIFIQMHLELDGKLSLTQAHAIADRLERRVSEAFGGAEVLIHQDHHLPGRPRRRAVSLE